MRRQYRLSRLRCLLCQSLLPRPDAGDDPGRRWPARDQQITQETPQLDGVTRVTVTDAAHRLFGQTLEVVHESSPRGKANLTLRLPNGQTRSVPRRATNFEDDNTTGDQFNPLPRISVRTILPLVQFVGHKLLSAEEISDDPANSGTREGNPGREQSPNTLAATRPADTSPADPTLGYHAPENAPDSSAKGQ